MAMPSTSLMISHVSHATNLNLRKNHHKTQVLRFITKRLNSKAVLSRRRSFSSTSTSTSISTSFSSTSQLLQLPQHAFNPKYDPPRVRFAPSPTGHLHLGGLRTALFNHLFARRWGGKWILRIEDTDRNRLVPGATEALLETLRWAGLDYDEGPDKPGEYGPYIQSERLHLYQSYADQLISSGKAYRDFRPQIPRDPKSKGPSRIRERNQYLPPDEDKARALIKNGQTFVVRLKHPPISTSHVDLVYNQLNFPTDFNAEDPILLKSDGWPTYHLASVIDDNQMKISHVIRGEEWLPSLPLHLHLYQSLDFKIPFFAHLPLLINPDGSKLSKRTGDTKVEDFIENGFEGESLCNFVGLMGWNHHNRRSIDGNVEEGIEGDKDVMTLKEMEQSFSISEVSHSRAALSLPKLAFLNRRHLTLKISKASDDPERIKIVSKMKELVLKLYDKVSSELLEDSYLTRVISFIQERADTLPEMAKQANFLFQDPNWSGEGLKMLKGVKKDSYNLALSKTIIFLRSKSEKDLKPENSNQLTSELHELAKSISLDPNLEGKKSSGIGNLMKPLRHALTGRKAGPTVAETLSILGLSRSIERLEDALKWSESKKDW